MTDWTKIVEMWASIIQTIAIIIAGIWAYFRYIKKRENYTKAVVELEVEHFQLEDKKFLVRVKVKVNNIGSNLFEPSLCNVNIYQVLPITYKELKEMDNKRERVGDSDDTFNWPLLKERNIKLSDKELVIEPNETEEIWSDFIIENYAKVVQIYSSIVDKEPSTDFWSSVKFLELKRD